MISLVLALAAAAPHAPLAPTPTNAACKPVYPPALRAWPAVQPLEHGFVVGSAVDIAPMALATIRMAIQPSKPLSGSHVATAGFEVKRAGRYLVAVGGAAVPVRPLWLDVVGEDRKPLTSVAHGHGPKCASITKIVEYDLKPGRYTLLATGLTSDAPVRALIVPKR